MNITKDNLLQLIDAFGKALFLNPKDAIDFDVLTKLDKAIDNVEYLKNNLDKPFTEYYDNGKRVVETLYEFIQNQIASIDIRDASNLGIDKDINNIKLPKKEIDVNWVWDKISKKLQASSLNLYELCKKLHKKLNLSGDCYPTSFGLSVNYLYNSNAENSIATITTFLKENDIKYKEVYSGGHWVVNIKISKEQENINKLKRVVESYKSTRYGSVKIVENKGKGHLHLRRVCEDRNHIENLRALLKLFSKDRNNWDKEWTVNPYYFVDLGRCGNGNCVCGHSIRYQFQFKNMVTGKTLPVGSTCVTLLGLKKYDDIMDKLNSIKQISELELDNSLDPVEFVKKYKKYFNQKSIDALADYTDLSDVDYKLLLSNQTSRSFTKTLATSISRVIKSLHRKASEVIGDIEKHSKPVSQTEVQKLITLSDPELAKLSTAKQGSLF